jgi:two-component system chemotaxis response regulator CheY
MANILVVDDSAIMRKNLRNILTKAGYNVIAEATNGLEAYQAFEKHRPDLVTMDITMPVMDGIQAVKKIIGSFPEAKIVVISAFDQRSMLFEAMENGAKHYIIKPITADKLLGVISEMLSLPLQTGEVGAAETDAAAADRTAITEDQTRNDEAQAEKSQEIKPAAGGILGLIRQALSKKQND